MNAKEARKLAEEMKPIQDEKERKEKIALAKFLADKQAKEAAEEAQKFEDRYQTVLSQIGWAVKKGRMETDVDTAYGDDKLKILRRLHADGYKARESTRYWQAERCDCDGYVIEHYTASHPVYKVEW